MSKRGVQDLIGFVHGEVRWDDLGLEGVEVDRESFSVRLSPDPDPDPYFEASPADVARGLLALQGSDQLRLWATILLAAPDCLEFTDEFETAAGEQMISALWDAAFGGEPSQEAVRVAKQLISEKGRRG